MAQEETMFPSSTIPLAQNQQQQNTAMQGVDILNQLLKQRNDLNQNIGQLTKEATIPIATSGPGTSPQFVIPEGHRFQPAPLIDKPTVGARSTRDKGIANTIIAASNLVGQYRDEHQQEQKRALAVDIERIFQSQDGIRQAQETLRLDPNNADAKQTIEKNNQIIDALLNDPKKRKQIEKSLDISFTDPSKNDQMEHGALQMASDSYSKQLQSKIPQQMQPNVVAQQKLALAQAQVQSIDKMITSITPALVREQGAMTRAQMSDETKRDITTFQQESANKRAQFNAAERYKAVMDGDTLKANAMLRGVAMRNAQSAENLTRRLNAGFELLKQRQNDPRVQAKGTLANIQAINGYMKDLTDQNAKLTQQQTQLATLYKNGMMSKEDYNTRSAGITELQKQNSQTLSQLKPLYDQSTSYIENLMKGLQSGTTTGSSESISGDSAGDDERYIIGPEEDIEQTNLDPDNF